MKLPNLKSFKIKNKTNPAINVKVVWDTTFMLMKLEYIYENVVEMFIKMVENPLTIFNTLCTTHYLEFKVIPPSDYEKILKQHSMFCFYINLLYY